MLVHGNAPVSSTHKHPLQKVRPGLLQSELLTKLGDESSNEQQDSDPENEGNKRSLEALTRRELRWGVVSMPPHLADKFPNDGQVQHLGFADVDNYISEPQAGSLYI